MPTTSTAVRTHVVTGHPAHVQAALRRAVLDGRLAGVRNPVELPGHRVQVTADLREPIPAARPTSAVSVWRWLRPVLAGLLVAGATAGLVWGMVLLVEALIAAITVVGAWVAGKLPLIIALGVGLLLVVPAGARCVGAHCGGCRQ